MAGQRTLPGLGLSAYWTPGSNGYATQHDPDTRLLSVMTQLRAVSRTTLLPGSPGAPVVYIVRSDDGTNPNKVAIWDGPSGSEAWVYLTPAEGYLAYIEDEDLYYWHTGSAWTPLLPTIHPYDIRFGFKTAPDASAAIDRFKATRDIYLPANLTGSLGYVNSNPGSSFVMTLKDDGSAIATITISTGGVYSFATTSGTAKTIDSGSLVILEAPGTPDGSIADMSLTVKATAAD